MSDLGTKTGLNLRGKSAFQLYMVQQLPESVFNGKRMKNGWKNSAPWVYSIDPEKIILKEYTSK